MGYQESLGEMALFGLDFTRFCLWRGEIVSRSCRHNLWALNLMVQGRRWSFLLSLLKEPQLHSVCGSHVLRSDGPSESRARVGGEEGLCSNNTIAALLKMSKRQMLRDSGVGPRQAR